MSDRSTLDAFERRIADEFERYLAPATDPKPAAEIASVAMRPRGLAVRARNAPRQRRFVALGLAAALLVPAALIGAGLRPPSLDVQPSPTDNQLPAAATKVSIFVRHDDGSEPGVSIFAVRSDGSEALLRKVPDSILAMPGTLSEWGTVSESGWLALGADYGGVWPMILLDLGNEGATPWVINQANLGGMAPRWGPTGLVAASSDSSSLVIANPVNHTTWKVFLHGHGLVGGGPSIVWNASGTGIVGSRGNGAYDTIPIDGSDAQPGVAEVFDKYYGPGLDELRVCSSDGHCLGGDDGRVERFNLDGSVETIWQQDGGDRALAASFDRTGNGYWLAVYHDKGRQVSFVHVHDGRQDAVAIVNRGVDWQSIEAPVESPDGSMAVVWVQVGAKSGAILVPLNGAPATFHSGQFAGFVGNAASVLSLAGPYEAPAATMPAIGKPYDLPTVEQLITAEVALRPGGIVLGKGSHDAVDGDSVRRTFELPRDKPGAGDVYVDCFGPSSVTATSGPNSTTNPCLQRGSYAFQVDGTQPITVTASGDTTWRVVIYAR